MPWLRVKAAQVAGLRPWELGHAKGIVLELEYSILSPNSQRD